MVILECQPKLRQLDYKRRAVSRNNTHRTNTQVLDPATANQKGHFCTHSSHKHTHTQMLSILRADRALHTAKFMHEHSSDIDDSVENNTGIIVNKPPQRHLPKIPNFVSDDGAWLRVAQRHRAAFLRAVSEDLINGNPLFLRESVRGTHFTAKDAAATHIRLCVDARVELIGARALAAPQSTRDEFMRRVWFRDGTPHDASTNFFCCVARELLNFVAGLTSSIDINSCPSVQAIIMMNDPSLTRGFDGTDGPEPLICEDGSFIPAMSAMESDIRNNLKAHARIVFPSIHVSAAMHVVIAQYFENHLRSLPPGTCSFGVLPNGEDPIDWASTVVMSSRILTDPTQLPGCMSATHCTNSCKKGSRNVFCPVCNCTGYVRCGPVYMPVARLDLSHGVSGIAHSPAPYGLSARRPYDVASCIRISSERSVCFAEDLLVRCMLVPSGRPQAFVGALDKYNGMFGQLVSSVAISKDGSVKMKAAPERRKFTRSVFHRVRAHEVINVPFLVSAVKDMRDRHAISSLAASDFTLSDVIVAFLIDQADIPVDVANVYKQLAVREVGISMYGKDDVKLMFRFGSTVGLANRACMIKCAPIDGGWSGGYRTVTGRPCAPQDAVHIDSSITMETSVTGMPIKSRARAMFVSEDAKSLVPIDDALKRVSNTTHYSRTHAPLVWQTCEDRSCSLESVVFATDPELRNFVVELVLATWIRERATVDPNKPQHAEPMRDDAKLIESTAVRCLGLSPGRRVMSFTSSLIEFANNPCFHTDSSSVLPDEPTPAAADVVCSQTEPTCPTGSKTRVPVRRQINDLCSSMTKRRRAEGGALSVYFGNSK